MKKNLLSIFGMLTAAAAFGQLPVSTTAENKNVILEEFTGISCTFCPDGHLIANGIKESNPADVFLINIHTGGFATPQGPGTDFNTSFGAAIAGQSNLAGYPAGTVNRTEFAGLQQNGTGTAMGRGNWSSAATTTLAEASYANVALEATVNAATREMTVDVEVYFTGTAPASVNLNVALTQNDIEGPQTGMAANPDQVLTNGNYNHTHMLRHMLTGQWGEVINSTAMGTTYSNQFTYTLPQDINGVDVVLGKLEVIAFIAEGQQTVVTGNDGPVTYTNLASDDAAATGIELDVASVCPGESTTPTVTITNNGQTTMTSATINYDIDGTNAGQVNWTGNLATFASEDVALNAIAVPANGGTVNVSITNVNGNTDPNLANNDISTQVSSAVTTGYTITANFFTDNYPSETSWEILASNGTVVASGGPYTPGTDDQFGGGGPDANTTITSVHTLPTADDCYSIRLTDEYGDGQQYGPGEGPGGGYGLQVVSGGVDVVYFDGGSGWSTVDRDGAMKTDAATSSLEELAFENVNVYPNPANDVLNVAFTSIDANTTVSITDLSGRTIASQVIEGANETLNASFSVSDLASGSYLVKISSISSSTTKNVIVK